MRIVSDPRLVEQLFLRWVQATEENAGNQPVDTGALTAEDWDAARKSLGAGSKSLLFGTSTKVLDAAARRFKQHAPASSATPTSQQLNDPTPTAQRKLRRTTKHVDIPPSRWEFLDPPLTPPVLEILSQWRSIDEALQHLQVTIPRITAFPIPENLEALRQAMQQAAELVDNLTEQSEGQGPKREPPSA